MKKPTLCVVFGGKSSEYEVSLKSVCGVLSHIDRTKYDLVRLGITRNGEWYIFEGENSEILNDTWHKGRILPVTVDLSSGDLIILEKTLRTVGVDLFFPVMHGEYVEDGRLQGLLDIAGAKYVGCGCFASHICMDKALTKDVAREIGVEVAKGYVLNAKCKMQNATVNAKCKMQNAKLTPHTKGNSECNNALLIHHSAVPLPRWGRQREQNVELWDALEGKAEICYPVFVKPAMCGSSVGVSRVENEGELQSAVDLAFKYCDKVLIEEAIDGYEVEVAVLERDGEITASPVGMIKYQSSFYDYSAKYESDEIEYLIPAPICDEVSEYIRECAKRLFVALGCRGLSRFDFFVKKGGGVVFNEVNTLPGFTEISMFPKLFVHMGYTYGEIIDALIAGGVNEECKMQNAKLTPHPSAELTPSPRGEG